MLIKKFLKQYFKLKNSQKNIKSSLSTAKIPVLTTSLALKRKVISWPIMARNTSVANVQTTSRVATGKLVTMTTRAPWDVTTRMVTHAWIRSVSTWLAGTNVFVWKVMRRTLKMKIPVWVSSFFFLKKRTKFFFSKTLFIEILIFFI